MPYQSHMDSVIQNWIDGDIVTVTDSIYYYEQFIISVQPFDITQVYWFLKYDILLCAYMEL